MKHFKIYTNIPFQDTCYDEEDGGTPKLNLHLLTTNRRELSPSAWLQFDTKNQEFVGIPLEEEVGREEYQLVNILLLPHCNLELPSYKVYQGLRLNLGKSS